MPETTLLRDQGLAPERILPEHTHGGPLAAHLKRYDFALPFCRGAQVLDAACGVGYGSARLAPTAASVVGLDISADAIAYGRATYRAPNLRFLRGDAQRLPFPAKAFDVVTSFETVEHVPDPAAFVAEVARVLRPGGRLLLSTPHVRRTRVRPKENPYHIYELSRTDLTSVLQPHFGDITFYGQRRRQSGAHYWAQRLDVLRLRARLPSGIVHRAAKGLATKPWDEVDLEDLVIDQLHLDRATELIAVCARPRKPA